MLSLLVLCRVDDQLNQVEQEPSELHQAIYQFTNGPVGQATTKGVQTAAKLTISATIETAKAAAPVGKWALQQVRKDALLEFGCCYARTVETAVLQAHMCRVKFLYGFLSS